MLRNYQLIVCVLLFLVRNGVQAEGSVAIENTIKSVYPSYILLSYYNGNFTNSSYEEYIAFYNDPKHQYEKNKPQNIDHVVVLVYKSGTLLNKYELSDLDVWSVGYDELHMKIIKNAIGFGKLHDYIYIGDYNSNGLDEILFFQLGGSFFLPKIIEFNGAEFVNEIDLEPFSRHLESIKSEQKDGLQILHISSLVGPNENDPSIAQFTFRWNERTYQYICDGN
jgi:hypothetical protein